jgi:hypothetical protein
MPINSLFSAVLRSVATILWVGKSERVVRWRCCHVLAADGQEAVPTPVLGIRESNKKRSIQEFEKAMRGALLGEFFLDGLDEFCEVKGFFEDATGTKEFCNIEEIAVALRAGHGDDLRVEILPRQL